MKEIVNRADLRSSSPFRSFIQLDNMIAGSSAFSPSKVGEITDLTQGGRDFVYVEEKNLIFVAMSEMKIASRMDSYLTNWSMPWEKKQTDKEKANNPTYSTVSAVAAYRIKNKPDGRPGFDLQKLWIKTFPLQIGCMHFQAETETIFIGFDKGVVHRLALTSNPLAYNDLGESTVHTMRVMGILATKDQYVSISDAGTMKLERKGKQIDMTPKGASRKLKSLHSQPDR